jgi:hypothetical protein
MAVPVGAASRRDETMGLTFGRDVKPLLQADELKLISIALGT